MRTLFTKTVEGFSEPLTVTTTDPTEAVTLRAQGWAESPGAEPDTATEPAPAAAAKPAKAARTTKAPASGSDD